MKDLSMTVDRLHAFWLILIMLSICVEVAEQLELTDGWFGLRAVCDGPLSADVRSGRLKPGT